MCFFFCRIVFHTGIISGGGGGLSGISRVHVIQHGLEKSWFRLYLRRRSLLSATSVLADNLLSGKSVKLANTTISGNSGAKFSSSICSSTIDLPFLSLVSFLCLSILVSLPLAFPASAIFYISLFRLLVRIQT